MKTRKSQVARKSAVSKSGTATLSDSLWMSRSEMLHVIRHEMRGAIDNLAAILAQFGKARLPRREIPKLVNAAEDSLRSLARLTESLRTILETDIRPTQMTTKESLHNIARAAIETLARASWGLRINLRGNQSVELICDRRMIEFLLTSLLIFLIKALREDRSSADIYIAVEDDEERACIGMRFYLSSGWHERRADDNKITWKMATTLIHNCGGAIEPQELAQVSQCLRISLPKR